MALYVNADHHSLPFHGSAYVREAAHLGLCLMEQHCVTAFNRKPSSPLFLFSCAGWRKRRIHTKLRQSSRRRRLSAWKQRPEMNISSRNRCVSLLYYRKMTMWIMCPNLKIFVLSICAWVFPMGAKWRGFALAYLGSEFRGDNMSSPVLM